MYYFIIVKYQKMRWINLNFKIWIQFRMVQIKFIIKQLIVATFPNHYSNKNKNNINQNMG